MLHQLLHLLLYNLLSITQLPYFLERQDHLARHGTMLALGGCSLRPQLFIIIVPYQTRNPSYTTDGGIALPDVDCKPALKKMSSNVSWGSNILCPS